MYKQNCLVKFIPLSVALVLSHCAGNDQSATTQSNARTQTRGAVVDYSTSVQLPDTVITQSSGETAARGSVIDLSASVPDIGGTVVRSSASTSRNRDLANSSQGRSGQTINNQAAIAVGNSLPASGSSHRVRAGETLYSIAFQYNMDFRSLAIANSLKPPYTIYVDQPINLNLGEVRDVAAANSSPDIPGTNINNNTVARSQGVSTSRIGVIRQPISSSGSREPEWIWPLKGQILNAYRGGSGGIDIAASFGQPVYASSDGEVVFSGSNIQGMGKMILIRHSDRYLSAYAHNSQLLVSEGATIRAGQQIAEAGAAQDGTDQLHFEIRVDGKSVDPLTYLPD